jgi:hypothetical protein
MRSNNFGLFLVALAILIVGGVYLYQQGDRSNPPSPTLDSQFIGFELSTDSGPFTTDVLINNNTIAGPLDDVDLTLVCFREDGQSATEKRHWASWEPKETKKINIPSANYQKWTISGKAFKRKFSNSGSFEESFTPKHDGNK